MTYASPIKLFEYLAAGKPVVSTPSPVVREFDDVVRIGATADEFIDHIECSLRDDPGAPARRMARVRPYTWAARAQELAGLLEARGLAS
jgi:glycosyltransferase involved in cell wall biosynthesis